MARLTRRDQLVILVVAVGLIALPAVVISRAPAPPSKPAASAPPAGYQDRVNQAILAHYQFPTPAISGCESDRGALNYATAALWLNESVADANAKLAAVRIDNIIGQVCDPSQDPSRANLWLSNLVRPYFLFKSNSKFLPGRLTTAASDNLLAQMWAYAAPYSELSQSTDPWSIYDSENHDAQAKSFDLLAAQAFMNDPAYQNRKYADGSTPAQQYHAWVQHWSDYFDERAKKGLFIEVGSPTYHGYLLDAILNIYNFAEDPVLREKAGMILDLDFADYAQQEFNDIWGGAKSRSFPASSPNGADDSMTSFGALLFGPASAMRPKYVLALATSGYYPPPVVQTLATDPAGRGSFAYVTRRPGVGHDGWDVNKDWHVSTTESVVNYAYVTPGYVMGTAELNPADTHIAPSSQNRWLGVIFNTGAGDRVYPQAAPTSDTKTADAFISVQSQNVMITRKQGYATEPTLVYFPSSLTLLEEKGGWLFAEDGSSYLAVRPATGTYSWLTSAKNRAADVSQRFISLSVVGSPIIFEAAQASQYASFAAFESRIEANARADTGGVLTYTASNGTKFTFAAGATPKVNGVPISYAPAAVFNSPYMHSVWNSGKITIADGAQSATYDFSNPVQPVKVVH